MQGPGDEIEENKSMGRRLVENAKAGSSSAVKELLHNGAPVNYVEVFFA